MNDKCIYCGGSCINACPLVLSSRFLRSSISCRISVEVQASHALVAPAILATVRWQSISRYIALSRGLASMMYWEVAQGAMDNR